MLDFILNIDQTVNTFFVNNFSENDIFYLFFDAITFLGNYKFILLASVFGSMYFWYKDDLKIFGDTAKKYLIPFWSSLIVAESITFFAKEYFGRLGPIGRALHETDKSFPSGHATIVVAFFGMLTYLLLKNNIHTNNKRKNFLIILTLIIILSVGFSRLVLNVHFLSDVLVGFLVGIFGLFCGIQIFKKINNH